MTLRCIPCLVVIVLAAAAVCAKAESQQAALDRARDAVDRAYAALGAHDLQAYSALFTEDSKFKFDGNSTYSHGPRGVAAMWAPLFKWTIAIHAQRDSPLMRMEWTSTGVEESEGDVSVAFMAMYAWVADAPKKRTQRCYASDETHALEQVTVTADGKIRRWSTLQARSVEDIRRNLKCLGFSDPDVVEKNVPCFDVVDRTWGILGAQHRLEIENTEHMFADGNGGVAEVTFNGETYRGAEGALRVMRSWFQGAVQTVFHWHYAPFCPETVMNVNGFYRTIYLVAKNGCTATVRSLERVELNNDRLCIHWDAIWDKSVEQVQKELDCKTGSSKTEL